MHRLHFWFYTLFLFLVLSGNSFLKGQSSHTYSKRDMRRSPVWIEMMNNPQANYYETIRAFREFWKNRILPKEAFEEGLDQFEIEVGLITAKESEKEREREARKASPKKREESNFYASDVRAFKGWMQDVKPWLRVDGSIITLAEREAMIQKQIDDQREQERLNKK